MFEVSPHVLCSLRFLLFNPSPVTFNSTHQSEQSETYDS